MISKRALAVSAGLLAAAGLALALAACKRSESAALPPPVPPEARSPAAAAIASHLDYGGDFFAVVDVKGELENSGRQITDLLNEVASQPDNQDLPKINYGPLLERLGLYGIEGAGLSSWRIRDEAIYHNRGFLYVPNGRQGLLKVAGGSPVPFLAPKLAPADADLVIEGTLDLKALADLILGYIRDIGGPDALAQAMAVLRSPIAPPEVTITWQWLLEHANTRLAIVARADPKATLALDPPLTIPQVDLVIELDGFADVYTQLEPALKDLPLFVWTEKNGMKIATWAFSIEPPFNIYKPQLIADPATKRLYLVSRAAFAEATVFGQGPRLAGSPDFLAATQHFPKEGNGLAYISKSGLQHGLSSYRENLARLAPASPASLNQGLLTSLIDAPHGLASAQVNLPDGILFQSVSPTSSKSIVMALPVAATGLFAAMAIPAFEKARDQSREKAITNNLRAIHSAAQQYMLEKGVAQVQVRDLLGPGPAAYLHPLTSVAGETYDDLVVSRESRELSVKTAAGQTVTYQF